MREHRSELQIKEATINDLTQKLVIAMHDNSKIATEKMSVDIYE